MKIEIKKSKKPVEYNKAINFLEKKNSSDEEKRRI